MTKASEFELQRSSTYQKNEMLAPKDESLSEFL
jgi:hypothetical protein